MKVPVPGPAEATFVPHTRSKSGTTNLPEGTVHIFRDGSTKPTPEELEAKVSEMALTDPAEESEGIMLGVLAVPPWMTPSDFLEFVAPAVDGIAHLRIIRYVRLHRVIIPSRFLICFPETLHQIVPWLSSNSPTQQMLQNLQRLTMGNLSIRCKCVVHHHFSCFKF